jgi:hypothetical protein
LRDNREDNALERHLENAAEDIELCVSIEDENLSRSVLTITQTPHRFEG